MRGYRWFLKWLEVLLPKEGLAPAPEKLLRAHGLGPQSQRPFAHPWSQVVVRHTCVFLEPLSEESQAASKAVQFL